MATQVQIFTADLSKAGDLERLQSNVNSFFNSRPNSDIQWLQSSTGAKYGSESKTHLTAIITYHVD